MCFSAVQEIDTSCFFQPVAWVKPFRDMSSSFLRLFVGKLRVEASSDQWMDIKLL